MTQPIVSVIIPTYNRVAPLRRAIQSVLNQTYRHFEVIVVDDASSVDVESVVEEFRDGRIRYIRHHTNRGVAAAKNTGIQLSIGHYVAFLDDDDVYVESKIERQLEVFERSPPSVGLVYCAASYVTGDGKYLGKKDTGNQSWDVSFHIDNIGPTSLIRRICFDDVGLFDESFECFEDWDMWLRISDRFDIRSSPESLYIDISHSSPQLSRNVDVMLRHLDKLYAKHGQKLTSFPRTTRKRMYSKYHKTRAVTFLDSGRIRDGRKEAIKSLLLCPLSAKLWKLTIGGLFGSRVYGLLRNLQKNMPESIAVRRYIH